MREPSAAIHLAMSMCVRFLVQGLTPQKAVKGAIVVPLDSPPLVYNNAVEFAFLSQGVWPLWACPFSRSLLGLTPKGEIWDAKVVLFDSPLLVCY